MWSKELCIRSELTPPVRVAVLTQTESIEKCLLTVLRRGEHEVRAFPNGVERLEDLEGEGIGFFLFDPPCLRAFCEREKQVALLDVVEGIADTLINQLGGVYTLSQLFHLRVEEGDYEGAQRCSKRIEDGLTRTIMVIQRLIRSTKDLETSVQHSVDLRKVIGTIIHQHYPDVKVVESYERDLPKVRVGYGFTSCLKEIFDNAVEATGESGLEFLEITIDVRADRIHGQVITQVTDNGPGIPHHLLTRVFTPFFTTRGTNKAGLGLWSVYQIVKASCGSVAIESKFGKGTMVVLRLPIDAEERSGTVQPLSGETNT